MIEGPREKKRWLGTCGFRFSAIRRASSERAPGTFPVIILLPSRASPIDLLIVPGSVTRVLKWPFTHVCGDWGKRGARQDVWWDGGAWSFD